MPTARELVRYLKRHGFRETRQRGSHLILRNRETRYRTVIPMHPGDLPTGLFRKILKDAGFDISDYYAG